MKPCSYCGRNNEDSAIGCAECGTKLDAPSNFEGKSVLYNPGAWVCLIAAIIVLQGLIRLEFTPHDPSLGEGDYKRVSAAFYFWLSMGVGFVLLGYGLYLMRRNANERKG
jgi:hypothetical protein